MSNVQHVATQARSSTTPASNEPELSPLEYVWLRRKLGKLYRKLTKRVREDFTITNNALGRRVLLVQSALAFRTGMSDADVVRHADYSAQWMSSQKRDAIIERAKHFAPTPKNIACLIGLTYDLREKHKAWAFPPCDKSPEEFERLKADKRNKRKHDKRIKRAAQIQAMPRPPREIAVLAAVDRLSQRPGPTVISVRDIMRDIAKDLSARHHFQFKDDDTLRVIRRILDSLQRDGLVLPLGYGWRGARLVIPADRNSTEGAVPPAAVPLNVDKPWEVDGISRRTWFRHRKLGLHRSRDTNPDTRTAVVPPPFPPQAIDDAMVSSLEVGETAVARSKVRRTMKKDPSQTNQRGLSKEGSHPVQQSPSRHTPPPADRRMLLKLWMEVRWLRHQVEERMQEIAA